MKHRTERRSRGFPTAAILIAAGVFLLMSKQGWIDAALLERWWPALLILAGILILVRPRSGND